MIASALLVHLSGGYIELHFHFFVVMSVIVLYQDWLPFLVGLQFIILDHGLVGTMLPAMVYRHPEGQAHPWTWALIHAGYILAQCAALLYFWRVNEAIDLLWLYRYNSDIARRRPAGAHRPAGGHQKDAAALEDYTKRGTR